MKEITNDPTFFFLQTLLSASIGPILLYHTLDCWVYPLRDYIGETGCHMIFFLRTTVEFIVQLQSFFTSIFRYICVFHNGSILYLNLSPYVSSLAVMILYRLFSISSSKSTQYIDIHFQMTKGHFFCIKQQFSIFIILIFFQSLAKWIVLINHLIPILSISVFTMENSPGLTVCLGQSYHTFFTTQVILCKYDNIYLKGGCLILFILNAIGSSNILDAYMIFCINKEMKISTEKVKTMIGDQAYINRKR